MCKILEREGRKEERKGHVKVRVCLYTVLVLLSTVTFRECYLSYISKSRAPLENIC
jgi:hypothetical protein